MSALAFSALLERTLGVPSIMHATTRDHNRLGAWSNLCGAKALGIETVLLASGDRVGVGDRRATTTVRDLDVYGLIEMARQIGLRVGVVFDPGNDASGIDGQVARLVRKVDCGAQFVVTQPAYDVRGVDCLADALASLCVPSLLGILPLRSARHAEFLHCKVAGIVVPRQVQRLMLEARDPVQAGVRNAATTVRLARQRFAGVCIMPPFDHYEMVVMILRASEALGSSTPTGVPQR
jgi:homocysteine S-methyltransferase